MNFWGYRRPDGRVGVRNNVLVLPASVCAADTCRIVASQVKGTVTFHNQNGCSQVACDMQLTMDTIAGFAANPKIYSTNKPMRQFIIQECGGTIATAEQAVRAAREMVQEASLQRRE